MEGQVDGGAFPATVTIDGKSFTVDKRWKCRINRSKTTNNKCKITTNANGTRNLQIIQQQKGTTLYITFGQHWKKEQ